MKQNKKSIALKLYHNARIILVVMLATMMTTLSFIIYSESSSRMFIQRMAYCIEIKTIISETIPGEIYDVLIGRTEMNHSKAFWAIVEQTLPDYKVRREWLRKNGAAYNAK